MSETTVPLPSDAMPAPLGQMPEFDIDEKLRSQQAAEIPHLTPEADPEILQIFEDLVGYANEFQANLGMEPTEITADSVHILGREDISEVSRLLAAQEDNGAVYDPRSDVLYVTTPEEKEGAYGRVLFGYALAHELGHKLTPGLNGSYDPQDHSHVLTEGMADRFARDFMHNVFLPKHFPDVAERISQVFEGASPYNLQGMTLRPEEVLFVDPDATGARGFSRIAETRTVEQLEASMGQEAFNEFVQQSLSTDILGPKQSVINQLGTKTWRLLTQTPPQTPPIEVLKDLQQNSEQALPVAR